VSAVLARCQRDDKSSFEYGHQLVETPVMPDPGPLFGEDVVGVDSHSRASGELLNFDCCTKPCNFQEALKQNTF